MTWTATWSVYEKWLETGECVVCVVFTHPNLSNTVGFARRVPDGLFLRAGIRMLDANSTYGASQLPRPINHNKPMDLSPPLDRLVLWDRIEEVRFYNPHVWIPWLNEKQT